MERNQKRITFRPFNFEGIEDPRAMIFNFCLRSSLRVQAPSLFSSQWCVFLSFFYMFLHVLPFFVGWTFQFAVAKKNLREFFWDGSRPWTPSVSSWVNVVRMRWDAWDDWVVATHRFLEISPRSLGEDEPILTLYYFSDGWLTPPTRGMGSWGGGLYRWLWGSGVFFFVFFSFPFWCFCFPFLVCKNP